MSMLQPAPQMSLNLKRKRILLIAIATLLVLALAGGIWAAATARAPYEPLDETAVREAVTRGGELSGTRKEAVEAAISLLGRVRYFWGGKSFVLGWDPEWGGLQTVTSKGSVTTGTQRPMGLDCSGYISWCFIQTGLNEQEVKESVGNGTANQWAKSYKIRWKELQPGDVAFQNEPNDPEGNHIGICIGFLKNGEPVFAHCAASFNDVVATPAGEVFCYARRPYVYGD